jgi:hypothetical protein
MRSIARVAIVLFASASAAGGCSRGPSLAAPTPKPSANEVVTAPSGAFKLTGRATEAPPTSSTGVWDATVTLDDDVNTWRSAKTISGVGRGVYTVSHLRAGRFRATVSADGFVSATDNLIVGPEAIRDFHLMPVPVTKSITVSDHLGDGDGTCSDGVQPRPCHIVAFPVHNSGSIEATVSWQGGQAVLNLLLFARDGAAPLIQSTPIDKGRQQMAGSVSGGDVYEVRIMFMSGVGPAAYTLLVSYPN